MQFDHKSDYDRRIIENSVMRLYTFIKENGWKGYDPYDGLNSKLTALISNKSKWMRILIIQLNRRSPINFRPFLGIREEISNKGMGLFASAFLKLYKSTRDEDYLKDSAFCLDFLKTKSLEGRYSSHCWGTCFKFQSVNGVLTANTPDMIDTVTCGSAFLQDYEMTGVEESMEIAKSSANFIIDHLYVDTSEEAFFKYSPVSGLNSHVYNASTHGAMLLANISKYIKDPKNLEIAQKVMDHIISKQKPNGVWYYSETDGEEKMQIDFHQGFILDDLYDFTKHIRPSDDRYTKALLKGAEFYKNEQFLPDGRAKWRCPRIYPIDIHNQAQGIVTFSKLSEIRPEYLNFAVVIAKWTIENMQDESGYFYYQKWPRFTNRIPYIRWGQAWMMLALSSLLARLDRCS